MAVPAAVAGGSLMSWATFSKGFWYVATAAGGIPYAIKWASSVSGLTGWLERRQLIALLRGQKDATVRLLYELYNILYLAKATEALSSLFNWILELPVSYRYLGTPVIVIGLLLTIRESLLRLSRINKVNNKYKNIVTDVNDFLQEITKILASLHDSVKLPLNGLLAVLKLLRAIYTRLSLPVFIMFSKFVVNGFGKIVRTVPRGNTMKQVIDKLENQSNKQTQQLINIASKADPSNSNSYKRAHSPTEVIQQLAHAQKIQVLVKERDKKLQVIRDKIEALDPENGKKTTQTRLSKLVKDEETIKHDYQKRIADERRQLLAMRGQNNRNKVQLPSPPKEFQRIKNFVAKTAMDANLNVRLRALENLLSKRNKTPSPRSPSPRKSVSARKTPSPPTPVYSPRRLSAVASAILKKRRQRTGFVRRLRR